MSEPNGIAVEFKQVVKSFGAQRVLNDVSFHVEQGQALCLLGRSGTGKSVTLKLTMALMCPDSGEIWVDRDSTSSRVSEARPGRVRHQPRPQAS